ncbi:MAG TPA: hypothetical protein VI874_04375 [Candidatus Norongarragalinales archaeon]|nr:hypothetical protein [Candidatus Norongarragalinales archaeon]
MEILHVKAKKWGNSIGVRLPKSLGIEPNQEIIIQVAQARKQGKVRDVWGLFKKKGHSTQAILDELNEELGRSTFSIHMP